MFGFRVWGPGLGFRDATDPAALTQHLLRGLGFRAWGLGLGFRV